MAMQIGVALPNGSATTLGELLDATFSNRSADLDSADAVFTPSEGNVLVANWPTTTDGTDLVYIRLAARPTAPEYIEL